MTAIPADGRITNGANWRGDIATAVKIKARQRLHAKYPCTPADLARAIAEYRGPINKLPPGWHAGHVPRLVSEHGS